MNKLFFFVAFFFSCFFIMSMVTIRSALDRVYMQIGQCAAVAPEEKCVCAESKQQTSNVFGSGTQNEFYAHSPNDYVLPSMGAYISISANQNSTQDQGQTLVPALTAHGSVIIHGPLIVMDNILLRMSDGATLNLSHFAQVIQEATADACVVECFQGVRNPFTCECLCNIGWQGARCDQPSCGNGGTLVAETNTCLCVAPWLSQSRCYALECGPHGYVDPVRKQSCICEHDFTGPKCSEKQANPVCNGTDFGSNCQYNCLQPIINTTLCPHILNLGYDMPCWTSGDKHVCACGGGFHIYDRGITRWQYSCAADTQSLAQCQQAFDQTSAQCCAPGASCDIMSSSCDPDSQSCCLQQTSLTTCHQAGCTWCVPGICVPDVDAQGSSDCSASDTALQTGTWQKNEINCMIASMPMCEAAGSRLQYMELYQPCTGLLVVNWPAYLQCLNAAQNQKHQLTWPGLAAADTTVVVETPVYWQLQTGQVLASRVTTFENRELFWSPHHRQGQRIIFMAAPFSSHNTLAQSAYFVTITEGLRQWCAVLTDAQKQHIYGTLDDLVMVPLFDDRGIRLMPGSICSAFFFTSNIVMTAQAPLRAISYPMNRLSATLAVIINIVYA